jgi:hypothetical protein
MTAPDDTADYTLAPAPHQAYVDQLWSELAAMRVLYAKYWAEHGRPHPDVCAVCKGRMGAHTRSARRATGPARCWARDRWKIAAIFRDFRKRGLSTHASKIGERVA